MDREVLADIILILHLMPFEVVHYVWILDSGKKDSRSTYRQDLSKTRMMIFLITLLVKSTLDKCSMNRIQ